jgi:hypothetical protein
MTLNQAVMLRSPVEAKRADALETDMDADDAADVADRC